MTALSGPLKTVFSLKSVFFIKTRNAKRGATQKKPESLASDVETGLHRQRGSGARGGGTRGNGWGGMVRTLVVPRDTPPGWRVLRHTRQNRAKPVISGVTVGNTAKTRHFRCYSGKYS